MPINDIPDRQSNLTPTQQYEANAAIYGPAPSAGGLGGRLDPNAPLNPEQAEFLRNLLVRYDQDHSQTNEFDLNKPPQKPYQYREFPRVVFHHERRATEMVNNQAQLEHYLATGWRKDPFLPDGAEPIAPVLSEADEREAAFVDAELKRRPKAK